jgi:hypothetical protein
VIFWIFWALDAIAAAIVVGVFFIRLGDGSVSSSNGGLWTVVLLGLAAILGAAWLCVPPVSGSWLLFSCSFCSCPVSSMDY